MNVYKVSGARRTDMKQWFRALVIARDAKAAARTLQDTVDGDIAITGVTPVVFDDWTQVDGNLILVHKGAHHD